VFAATRGQVVSALCGGTGLRQKVDVTRQSFGRLIVIIDEQAMDVKGGYKKISQFRGIRFPSEIGRNGGSDLAGIGLPADAASPVTPGAINGSRHSLEPKT
jgi:hypothetical protein